jgi:hypothetical protein
MGGVLSGKETACGGASGGGEELDLVGGSWLAWVGTKAGGGRDGTGSVLAGGTG